MGVVCLVMAAGLAVAVFRTEGGVRWFLFGCCLLNLVAARFMIADDFAYTWALR